ncbi:MAG: hypothetical protein NVSMB66_5750 [Candidatus Doudnabacteria bacterium]
MKKLFTAILLFSLINIVFPYVSVVNANPPAGGTVTIVTVVNSDGVTNNSGSTPQLVNPNGPTFGFNWSSNSGNIDNEIAYVDGAQVPFQAFNIVGNNQNNPATVGLTNTGSTYVVAPTSTCPYQQYCSHTSSLSLHMTGVCAYDSTGACISTSNPVWVTSAPVTFYTTSPYCSVSVSRSVNGGASFTSSTYGYVLVGPQSVPTTSGDYTYSGLLVGNYTINPSTSTSTVTSNNTTFTADASSNSASCAVNGTLSLLLPYTTEASLQLR